MGFILNEIAAAAKICNAKIEIIPIIDSKSIKERVDTKFLEKTPASTFIWDNLIESFVINNSESWQWCGEFAGTNPIYIFFLEHQEENIVRIEYGRDLTCILSNCSAFEFYTTDFSINYLLCFNHHDQLIGSGSALDWLKDRDSTS